MRTCVRRELLPTIVMDECMRLHDECLRKLLAKHRGYESATEGANSTICAHAISAARYLRK